MCAKEKQEEFIRPAPLDYYNFDLQGIVVHMGTADSGHYYSFIKETESFEKQDDPNSEQWMEFNDSFVSEFDPADIPA